VLRNGEQRTVPATAAVAGDLLVLAEGDIVPADADVVDAAALLVNESALTGESVPADKAAGRHGVSAGTTVVRGRGQAVVTATGAASAWTTTSTERSPPQPSRDHIHGDGQVR
jgi:P-type Ca2+ transporter type 2C